MEFIPQMVPWFGVEEKAALSEYMDGSGFITEYKRTGQFERMIAEYTGAKHCIVVNNGTISLTLAAMALGVKAGDEVIVPNYTMIATPNSIKMFGAHPVFADVEPDTLCLDIAKVKQALTSRTKAIMLVSPNGRYPLSGIDAFVDLAREHGVALIEDAAQSLGSHYPDGRHIGTAGRVGSFSFSTAKIITTGQGGALVTDDDDIASKLRRLKDFGRTSGGNDIHDTIGYNFKFTDIQACIGIAQMAKLAWRVERKKEILRRYHSRLSDLPQVRVFRQDLDHTTPWFIDVLVDDRDRLRSYLHTNGVGTRLMYPPINRQKAYGLPDSYPVSERVGSHGLWLPSQSQIEDAQIDYITERIAAFYR
jgi:perosamine synthetase